MNFIKTLVLCSIGVLLAPSLSAQDYNLNAIDTYFQKYVEDEDFSVVYISPRLFQLIGSIGGDNLDLDQEEEDAFIDMASDLRGLRILSTDNRPESFFNEFKSKIETKVYEPLITIREKDGGKIEFFLRENDEGQIEELLFFSFGEEQFTLMSFVGPLQLNKVIKLADELENKRR